MGNCSSGLETIPIPGIDGNLDESSKELLLKALSSKENGVETIRTLIASNVNVNHKLEYEAIGSCYPLHIASKLGNVNAVGLLLEGGGDNTLTDSQGRIPLHWAVAEEHLDVVDKLIEAGADVNAFDEEDTTPLHLAIKTNNEDLVQKLLDAGAEISPEKGENPLITSVKGEHIKVILPLLKAGASPVGLNFDFPEGGPTCLQSWASANGHSEIAAFLKEKFPEEGAVSEMEKEIKEENEQREGGDGAEDIATLQEAPLQSQPPEDSQPEETAPDPQPEESPPEYSTTDANATSPGPDATSPEPATSREPTPAPREPTASREATPAEPEDPPAAAENELEKETSPSPDKEKSPSPEKEMSPAPESEKDEENKTSKDASDNEDDKKTTDA